MLDYLQNTGAEGVSSMELVSPTPRGQVTIPKRIRDALRPTPKTKLRVYADGGRVVFEPVSPLDSLLDALETEASAWGRTSQYNAGTLRPGRYPRGCSRGVYVFVSVK